MRQPEPREAADGQSRASGFLSEGGSLATARTIPGCAALKAAGDQFDKLPGGSILAAFSAEIPHCNRKLER